jgi:hypothetical protein
MAVLEQLYLALFTLNAGNALTNLLALSFQGLCSVELCTDMLFFGK